jgi:translation initiation factor 5B
LLPPANKDQRVQKEYTQVRAVHAAMGFKIIGPDLSRVLAGSSLYVVPSDKYYEPICDKVQEDLSSVITDIDMDRRGVFLHASSLGSLEALITLLKHEKIPISGFDIGTVHKASVTMAATQLAKAKPEYALILAFDVKVDAAAQKEADAAGVSIFAEDVIYHLHDKAVEHFKKVRDDQRSTHKPVFPCSLKFSKEGTRNRIFHASDPILIGVIVTQGTLHVGTPLISFFPGKSIHLMNLGTVLSIKLGNDFLKSAKKDQEVSITIGRGNLSTKPELTEKNTQPEKNLEVQFLSKMSGFDADFLLENFKEDLTDDDTKLISAFKKLKLI